MWTAAAPEISLGSRPWNNRGVSWNMRALTMPDSGDDLGRRSRPIVLFVFALPGPGPTGQRFDQPTGYWP